MAIDKFDGGAMFTGPHIRLFQLLALKSGLKLQEKGIRLSRSTTATKAAARLMGVPSTNVKAAQKWVKEEITRHCKEHNIEEPASDD